MTRHALTGVIGLLLILIPAPFSTLAAEGPEPLTLFDFGPGFESRIIHTNDAQAGITRSAALGVRTGHAAPWPGVTLRAPDGYWDLSAYDKLTLQIANQGDRSVTVYCRVDNPGADGTNHCVTDSVAVEPNTTRTLTVRIFPVPWRLDEPLELIGMRAAPTHSGPLDTSNVTQLVIFVNHPERDYLFDIDDIRVSGQVQMLEASTFLPFIDEFGQFIHIDWPGKTHSHEELIAQTVGEEQDLDSHPGPEDRDRYGGWLSGPKLTSTRFFRVEKYQDKWWLIDPEGRLFWSHGIDCVGSGNITPITDREHYFQDLPAETSTLGRFYGSDSWAPHGYYQNHVPYRTYDFSRANLHRKYGPDFEEVFADLTHRRLRSWGINTIANWSAESIYLMRRTPYVATIHYEAPVLEGSEGYWGKFYDVFDPRFAQQLRIRLAREKGRTASDRWCIGYFVDNELSWGDDTSLAVATLLSPADQAAKKVFLTDLEARYKRIEALNDAWGTAHASWEALRQSQTAPDTERARQDLEAFYTKTAETYFRTVRDEIKRIAPNQLYLGCRFAWVNDLAARAAISYCDVVSYNRYEYSVENFALPEGADMPVIIGEFHFGALDRGMFHTGLRVAESQQDRANRYDSYVRGALRNPHIVGTHWFQYQDQATTGRGDGENYQIGFIDVCDRPYPEIVAKARAIGADMYAYRLESE